ncbi:MAG: hypothetical protein V3S83_12290 [Gemmatimonadota bacterium]
MTDAKHVPISFNFIHKGNSECLLKCVDSVYGALYKEGDECVVVDTGSSRGQHRRLCRKAKKFPNCRVINRKDLSVDYRPLIEEYLGPKYVEEFLAGGKTLTGILDFAEARNVAMDASENDVIFWADSDDVLVEEQPGQLRTLIDHAFGERDDLDNIFLDYDYAFDDADGARITLLRRERVFRKSRMCWKGRCHETAVPREGIVLKNTVFDERVKSKIVHTDARKAHRISDIRNYIILRKEMEEVQEADGFQDPRTVFYLANAARGLGHLKEAQHYYDWFDYNSGSVDDRFGAAYYRASMYLDPLSQRPLDAMQQYWKCIQIKPLDPRGYIGVSRCFGGLSRWKECLAWYDIAQSFQMSREQIFSYDPTHVSYHPHVMAAYAAQELELTEKARECITRAYQARPGLAEAQEHFESIRNWSMGQEMKRAVTTILHNVPTTGPNHKRVATDLLNEVAHVPDSVEKMGFGKIEPLEGRKDLPSMAIYCGHTGETWGPYIRKTGMGGSEKMVVMLADALQKTGKVNVTVYCNIEFPARGIYDTGVAWYHWSEFDHERPRDVLVVWRSPETAARMPCPAKKRVLWNHDVQDPGRYSEELLALVDHVQCQSFFHAKPVKELLGDKLWIARNAIEPSPEYPNLPGRDPKQVFFCSSPDRGLRTAAEIVKRARAIDPEISFVVSYGVTPWARQAFARNPHTYIPDLGRDASTDEYERECQALLDKVNATNVHRIGFDKMNILMQTSGVWLYPTRFPEISCMSAMEAQANGCVVLATDFGALEETILQYSRELCPKLDDLPPCGEVSDEWFDEAARRLVEACEISAASHEIRQDIADAAEEYFNVDALAAEWLIKLGLDLETAAEDPAQGESVLPAQPLCADCGSRFPVMVNPDGSQVCDVCLVLRRSRDDRERSRDEPAGPTGRRRGRSEDGSPRSESREQSRSGSDVAHPARAG